MTEKRYIRICFYDKDGERWMIHTYHIQRNIPNSYRKIADDCIEGIRNSGDYPGGIKYVLSETVKEYDQLSLFECAMEFNDHVADGHCPLGGWNTGLHVDSYEKDEDEVF
jgi:hypothetical protein